MYLIAAAETSGGGCPVFVLGFSAVDYALEGLCIVMKIRFTADATTPSRSYSFLAFNSTIHTSDPHADNPDGMIRYLLPSLREKTLYVHSSIRPSTALVVLFATIYRGGAK
uniref:AlNc14C68G4758 protein n=1 Tax=Albugo laibachii Nc14 TaxID=890382 RepID=F0WDN8_9STRA|nr:AlNc14C68G4758 [Albugo laibachii Nc14]|eukprot:CCA19314.1 AlNc14C68G4758 [Albugo laibachii Nc14]